MGPKKGHVNKSKVYVGNLDFQVSEDDLKKHFGQVGAVKSVNIIFDKDTRKSRGFAFVQYFEPDVAEASVRNLNNTNLLGRTIRVDVAEDSHTFRQDRKQQQQTDGGHGGGSNYQLPPSRVGGNQASTSHLDSSQPYNTNYTDDNTWKQPIPQPAVGGADAVLRTLPTTQAANTSDPTLGLSAPNESIQNKLQTMSPQQIYVLMQKMKVMIDSDESKARKVLESNPQFARMLLQAQVLLGMVKTPEQLNSMGITLPSEEPGGPAGVQFPMMGQRAVQGVAGAQPMGSRVGTQQMQADQVGGAGAAVSNKEQLLSQLMNLTDEQISKLPPDQQQRLLEIRQQQLGQQ